MLVVVSGGDGVRVQPFQPVRDSLAGVADADESE